MAPIGFDDLAEGAHDAIKCTFGEENVIYRPLETALAAVSLVGVFNARHQFVDPDTEQLVSSNQPTLGVKRKDLSQDPVKGDLVTIRNKKYRVHDSQEDGEGWIELFLFEVGV